MDIPLKYALKEAKAAEGTIIDQQYLTRLQYLTASKTKWIGAAENQFSSMLSATRQSGPIFQFYLFCGFSRYPK